MTLAQLQAFVTVIETGSFTAASEVLGMTQSAVSHSIASLETELGVMLLERDRTGITLTEVGKKVIVQARDMLAHAEQIRQETAAARGLEQGKLRLGSFPSVSARLLPGMIREFRRCYPGIEVVLFEGMDQEVREWITSRAVDVGFVTLPTKGMEIVPVAQDEMLVVVAASHPLAEQTHVRIEQLVHESFILSKGGCEPLIMALFRKAKAFPNTQFEVRDMGTILAMVQEGIGITIVPEFALSTMLTGVHVLHLRPSVLRRLALAVSSFSTASPAVTAFLHHAQQWAKSQGYIQR